MSKSINANLYTSTRLVYDKENDWHYEHLEDDCLYAKMKYPTHITPKDLPEWFVKGKYYGNDGFLSARDVQNLKFKPNYHLNHLHKDDVLFVSYRGEIEEYTDSFYGFPEVAYRNFDYAVEGSNILNFLLAVKIYSPMVDTEEIEKEMIKKSEWFLRDFPDDADAVNTREYIDELKKLFNK